MNLYPAIDIFEGRAVRLRQGRRDARTDSGTPVEMAVRWVRAGARWLHVVDLDGAFAGQPRNAEALARIRDACPEVKIQAGGGIREMAHAEDLMARGIDRLILGTAAVADPDFLSDAVSRYRERVGVGIDARDGMVRLGGWTEASRMTAIELAARMEQAGVGLIVYTDIARDGELVGIDLDGNRRMLEATGMAVIASGGVSSDGDILRLRELEHPRLDGVIIGKALYEGRIKLEEILTVTDAG